MHARSSAAEQKIREAGCSLCGKHYQPCLLYTSVTVYCYSNYEEVELSVNGKSYGRKRMERDWFLKWENIIYEPGVLCAVGYQGGREATREEVRTTGPAERIEMTAYENCICADGQDIAIINVRILDKYGRVVPTADRCV